MPQLDAIRALAVAAVVFCHWIHPKYHFGFPFGHLGVQAFFILSGFLITGILLRCQQTDDKWFVLKAFYIRRMLRIFPLYYLVIIGICLFQVISVREALFWHVPYLSNIKFFLQQSFQGHITHFWSLAVEEQFYLFWPLIILFSPQRVLLRVILLVIGIGFTARCLPFFYPDVVLLEFLLISNVDALGLGALLALIKNRSEMPSRWVSYSLWAAPVYICLYALRATGINLPMHFFIEHVTLLLALLWLIDRASRGFSGWTGQFLTLPPLLYLGRISYGLYVLHMFAFSTFTFLWSALGFEPLRFRWDMILRLVLMGVLTITAASLSWRLIEVPCNSLKRYFPYRKDEKRRQKLHQMSVDDSRRLAA